MLLALAGAFITLLGVFCGAMLLVAPTGWTAATVDVHASLWLLFPALVVVGHVLIMIGAPVAQVRAFTAAAAAALWVLALGAVTLLVLGAAGLLHPVGATLGWWYVMAVGAVLGFGGAARGSAATQGA